MTSLLVQPVGSAKAPVKVDHPDYGINKAIELMRMLPNDDVELIVRVVKTTLESTNINEEIVAQQYRAQKEESAVDQRRSRRRPHAPNGRALHAPRFNESA